MTVLSVLSLTKALAQATGDSYIVIDAYNDGSNSRWPQAFPSLHSDQTELLGEPFAIPFATANEAQNAFNRICSDVVAGPQLISGTITYVSRDRQSIGRFAENAKVETVSFDISEDFLPVFDHGSVRKERIVERIG